MKRSSRMLAVFSLLAVSASVARAQALPSANDVIAKYVAAVGGRDAILKVTSITQKARMEIPAAGLTADVEQRTAAPNMMAAKTTIAGVGEIVQGYNGTIGWEISPLSGTRLMTEQELTQAKENYDFHGGKLLDPSQFKSLEVLAVEDFGGEKAYKVKTVRKSGNEATMYFSVASGLLIGAEATSVSAMGTNIVNQRFLDYKDINGLKTPMRTESSIGPNSINLTITSITYNDVPKSAFDVPDVVKPLINK